MLKQLFPLYCNTKYSFYLLYSTSFPVSCFLNNVHAPVYWGCFSYDWPVKVLIHRNARNDRRYAIHLPSPLNYVILNSKHPGNLEGAWLEKRGCQQITWRTEQENSAVILLMFYPLSRSATGPAWNKFVKSTVQLLRDAYIFWLHILKCKELL